MDGDTEVNDASSIMRAIADFVDPSNDLYFSKGPADVLDHSSERFAFGGKLGIDATRKWKNEGFDRRWPKENNTSEEVKRIVDEKWKKLGL